MFSFKNRFLNQHRCRAGDGSQRWAGADPSLDTLSATDITLNPANNQLM
ncbi:hypothetical protein PULV_b0451 [Pseudoalteromonas ulvae UL12]|nr:hypothetical protein [Pseudoalteromonas ulvae UL12]